MTVIVWYRGKDLRIADHAPLTEALALGGPVIPLFVLDPHFFEQERAKELPHRMQFLLQSIASLQDNLRSRGSDLVLVRGRSVDLVPKLAQEWGADRVVAHRWVEPFGRARDARIQQALGDRFILYEGETLCPPGTLRTGAGRPYAVFTRFARNFERNATVRRPLPAPKALPPLPTHIADACEPRVTLQALGLKENPSVLPGGERAARRRLKTFIQGPASNYAVDRDRMDLAGTSRLSTDLKFGTLSVNQVYHTVIDTHGDSEHGRCFINELLWREFAHSTLWDRPELLSTPFRPKFEDFPWRQDEAGWRAWTEGRTGYPLVDAAARQLLGEGFVHNRARMIAASFLTKHLLIDYRRGEAHYMKYLADGDCAQNNMGWQWSAGCGCDAQPYFRVFNPFTQGKKADPSGDYVRRWVPELSAMPTKYIHAPWTAPDSVLSHARIVLGEHYPQRVVDHPEARERFLGLAKLHLKASA